MKSNYTKQIMFYELGYYTGKIDGIWGVLSKDATRRFQEDYDLDVDSIYGPKTEKKLLEVYEEIMSKDVSDEDYKKIKYFKIKELECKCGCGYNQVNKKLLYHLDTLRYYLNEPMYVTSGCRCESRNISSGGVRNSRHFNDMLGSKACDFYTKSTFNLENRKKIIDFYINYFPSARYAYTNGYYNSKGTSGVVSNGMTATIHVDVD